MKARHRLLAPIAAGLLLAGPALASAISGPLKLADLVALNGSGATYGPPTAAPSSWWASGR